MADVLLTHSYHLYYDRKQSKKAQPYPPLGTLYAAALLRRAGFSVALFDTMLNDPGRAFQDTLARHRPRLVVVYEDNFNFLSKMCLSRMREVAYQILRASRSAGAKVLMNGSDACDHPSDYLREGCHFVLLGEAEWTLLELAERLLDGRPLDPTSVMGVAYLNPENGALMRTARRPAIRDLDSLPLPARDLLEIKQYREAWTKAHGFFSLNLVASRGCPYRCNWCAKPIYGNGFSLRSPASVAEEMRQLKYDCGADRLWFADDIFGLRAKWVRELALEVEKLDAALPFKMQTRVDLITPDTAAALRRAGCVEAWMGAESGSQRILDAMDKGTRVEQIVKARECLRQEGIRACYFIQFGYPGESWEDIQSTVQLIRATRPDDIGVSVSYPLPGTVFHERVRTQIGDKTNWSDSEDLSMMFHGPYNDRFYRTLHDALHAEVGQWSSQNGGKGKAGEPAPVGAADARRLWEEVVTLEGTCRNPHPTVMANLIKPDLVQLESRSQVS